MTRPSFASRDQLARLSIAGATMMLRSVAAIFTIVFLGQTVCARIAKATEPISDAQMRFFENEVRPLLAEKCWDCHSADDQKGDLRLDSLGEMLRGGESGAAIVPGKPDESLLIEAVQYASLEMPPDEKLSDDQIKVLERWVQMGAPWPGSEGTREFAPRPTFTEEDRQWWAIQPIRSPEVPVQANDTWSRGELDRFIFHRLQDEGLQPAPEADRLALVRRLYFDVIGLPPTPEQVQAFLDDRSPTAYEDLVDRLLDSPTYGERAARQWLDVVRFAESDGYRADGFRPDAWRYRDYVIKSFNDDKPYDRFVKEQLAADELYPDDLEAQVALGYLRHWIYEWNIRDAPGQWRTIMEDLTDTTADVFLGLGLQCAKCHNHKFDPLLQKDYFRLQAFFAPLMPREISVATPDEEREFEQQKKLWEEKTAAIQQEIALLEQPYRDKLRDRAIDRFPPEIAVIARKAPDQQSPYEQQISYLVWRQVTDEYKELEALMKGADKERVLELKRQLTALKEFQPKPLPTAMAVTDLGAAAPPTALPKRPDEPLLPGIPSILDEQPLPVPVLDASKPTTFRRAALANWITDPANPLPARVIVNRIWQGHFGKGLAANASDFGRLGETPTHPELLDWLATEFVRGGWSLKQLHRTILISSTYRQSSTHPEFAAYQLIDPQNRFYWRFDTRRLQAEQIRDAVLAVSGQLKPKAGGPSTLADGATRTIYTRMMRNSSDELLDAFDLPLFFSSNSSRNTTTTPVQSLLLINSDLMLGHARKLAGRIQQQYEQTDAQVDAAWEAAFGRPATDEERSASLAFLAQQTARVAELQEGQLSRIVETGKLPYRDGQAVRFQVQQPELQLEVQNAPLLNVADFTIESFIQIRSIDAGGTVRTIVGKWDGDRKQPGWSFGITGQGSRRKPQTLVVQLAGKTAQGEFVDRAIFSDHLIELNKPYFVAASVRLAKDGQPGAVQFFVKDLSNDDEPLLLAEREHDIAGGLENTHGLTLGRLAGKSAAMFDGLVDDVRLVGQPMTADQLLYAAEKPVPKTIGFWKFESDPGVMRNSIDEQLPIQAQGKSVIRLSPAEMAFADFCHALLNSNEFLYVH